MKQYTVKQLASISNVSVRTLHYYDQIGLLIPSSRNSANYRLYEEKDLLRLQEILLYKEVDLPLIEIKKILEDPSYDAIASLIKHKNELHNKINRYDAIIKTIDKTINYIKGENVMITEKELYDGLSNETIEEYKKEAIEMYGFETVQKTHSKLQKLKKHEWENIKNEGGEITNMWKNYFLEKISVDNPEVQKVADLHYNWLKNFYEPNFQIFKGLGELYITNPKFRKVYDKFAEGLADYIKEAIDFYVDKNQTNEAS